MSGQALEALKVDLPSLDAQRILRWAANQHAGLLAMLARGLDHLRNCEAYTCRTLCADSGASSPHSSSNQSISAYDPTGLQQQGGQQRPLFSAKPAATNAHSRALRLAPRMRNSMSDQTWCSARDSRAISEQRMLEPLFQRFFSES